MAEKINELMSSDELRKQMAEATSVGVKKFDKNKIIKQGEELLDNI